MYAARPRGPGQCAENRNKPPLKKKGDRLQVISIGRCFRGSVGIETGSDWAGPLVRNTKTETRDSNVWDRNTWTSNDGGGEEVPRHPRGRGHVTGSADKAVPAARNLEGRGSVSLRQKAALLPSGYKTATPPAQSSSPKTHFTTYAQLPPAPHNGTRGLAGN